MMDLLRIRSAIYLSSYCFPVESNSTRKSKKKYSRCFRCGLGNLGSTKQRSFKNPSRTDCFFVVSMIRGTACEKQSKPLIQQKGYFVAQFSFHSGLVYKEEAGTLTKIEKPGLLILDRKEDEFGATGFGDPQITPRMDLGIPEEIDSVPSSNPQSRFSIPELKVHFLEERNEEILSQRILSLSRSNKVRSAVEWFLSMNVAGLRTSSHACSSLLACLIRNSLIDDALLVFQIMSKKRLATGHAYSLLLKAVADIKGYKSAVEMFRLWEYKGESEKFFDIVVYNTMISICGKAKHWVETEEMWRKFKQNNLSGTMMTFSLLISTFVQCGQTELALDAYHEMVVEGLEPDEDIMKAIVASCTKDGNWGLALNTFKKMLDSSIKPSIIAYNSVINCLGKAGEYGLAFKVYEHMKCYGPTPDAYTLNALLCALYRSKRYADALRLFGSIRALTVSHLNAQLYNTALMSCQRLGLWEQSVQLLWQMETSGMEISVISYNHVIHACETARRPEVALQVYQHMIDQKQTPDTFTYLSLIRACIWGSLWTEVEKILECIPIDASLYNALVQGFSLRNKIVMAKKMYTKMRSIGLTPDGKTRALMLQQLSTNGIKQHIRSQNFKKK